MTLRHFSARLLAAAATGALVAVSAPVMPTALAATVPVPAIPTGLPTTIEAAQPYVGQTVCDPVAKPGVAAFRDLVLKTYPATSSLGIVRDCGIGEQSEHKEGRAWDWGVSVTDSADVADVNALTGWLLQTDASGHPYAMADRLGLMYMIWNKHIWKAYQPSLGWQPYSGADPHTGHVHFSFGWNGAKKVTSFWDGTVAAVDYGPAAPVVTTTYPTVTPVPTPANLAVVRTNGGLTLSQGSTGAAVIVLQKALRIGADGDFGNITAGAVRQFQTQRKLPVTGIVARAEWVALFPPPINPFGNLDDAYAVTGGTRIGGWSIDADTTNPVSVTITADGKAVATTVAKVVRDDVATVYPGFGTGHGFQVVVSLATGTHVLCATATNAPGTPGVDAALTSCKTVTSGPVAVGVVPTVAGLLHALPPTRIYDTRTSAAPVQAGADRFVSVLGVGGVPTTGVSAVVVNATVPASASSSYLQVYPAGSKPATPTSNVNWRAQHLAANAVTVKVGTGGKIGLMVGSGSANVLLDVVGWYGDGNDKGGSYYQPLVPSRIMDTRVAIGAVSSTADRTLTVIGVGGVPATGASAVVMTLTAVDPTASAYVQAFPTGTARPATSVLNVVPGQVVAGLVTTSIGTNGRITFHVNSGRTDLVADVLGYYTTTGSRYVPLTPRRVLDRAPVSSAVDRSVVMGGVNGVPTGATAVVINATGLRATRPLDLEMYPTGAEPARRTSVLNLQDGSPVADLVVVPLGAANHALSISANTGSADVILDVVGYFIR